MANIFVNDPLLGARPQDQTIEQQLNELTRIQQQLEAQRQQMEQASRRLNQTQAGSGCPLWDEIERMTADMTDSEYESISRSEEFRQSQSRVMELLNREYMRIMRPIVEQTKGGHDALENHLALIRRMKKQASKDAERNMALFNEYTERYSDKTFAEFLQMKNKNKKS